MLLLLFYFLYLLVSNYKMNVPETPDSSDNRFVAVVPDGAEF